MTRDSDDRVRRVRARVMLLLLLALALACGGKRSKTSPERIDPPLTDAASRASLCKSCDPERSVCEILVGRGAAVDPNGDGRAGGGASAVCGRLPDECRGSTDCFCFPALKGCRCEHTAGGFHLECPAP